MVDHETRNPREEAGIHQALSLHTRDVTENEYNIWIKQIIANVFDIQIFN